MGTEVNKTLGLDVMYILLTSTEDVETKNKQSRLNVHAYQNKPLNLKKVDDIKMKIGVVNDDKEDKNVSEVKKGNDNTDDNQGKKSNNLNMDKNGNYDARISLCVNTK